MRDVDGSYAPVCICVTVGTRTEWTIYGGNMLNILISTGFGYGGYLEIVGSYEGPNFLT